MMRFAGYAAIFDRVDRAGDVMRRGAFADAAPVPLLLQHRGAPVGTIDSVGEDERGLRVAGTIADPALAAQVRGGALAGLSVGYRPRTVRQGAHRELTAVDLVEISFVALPMQPLARVDTLESTLSTEEPTHE